MRRLRARQAGGVAMQPGMRLAGPSAPISSQFIRLDFRGRPALWRAHGTMQRRLGHVAKLARIKTCQSLPSTLVSAQRCIPQRQSV